ncbi:hypothetical protein J4468_03430 [Candidatus Woesearchaeota archaeon]|nr:hypothetical protein [Candidatus Woesearchaeota archaeon]
MKTNILIGLLIVALLIGGGIGYYIGSYTSDIVAIQINNRACANLQKAGPDMCNSASTCTWMGGICVGK